MSIKKKLAQKFRVAESTVDRWLKGISKPHPRIQKFILDYLK